MNKISSPPEALPDTLAAVARTPGVAPKHDFSRLLVEIASESNFKSNSVNRVTGAAGAYQFIRSTWLALLKKYGESAGVKSSLVKQIYLDGKGRPRVANAQALKDLLGLRHDAVIASKMASHYLDDGSAELSRMLHRAPSEAEAHFAYLLGPTGAANLIQAAQQTPAVPVDEVIGGCQRQQVLVCNARWLAADRRPGGLLSHVKVPLGPRACHQLGGLSEHHDRNPPLAESMGRFLCHIGQNHLLHSDTL